MPVDRRSALKLGASALALGSGTLLAVTASGQGRPTVNLQLGWLLSGNQLGEACAKGLGYYDSEGIAIAFQPGGPNIDGIAIVASGKFECGQVSSSPSLMLAVSQDIPVRCFAVGGQQHPYTFFSLKKNPIREPKDLIGKRVGIQATGIILLKALLAKNKIDERQVTIVPSGADMTPLMTGQVDAFTGWQTNTTALRVLGDQRVDMRLWDTGVKLYALPYYATVDTLRGKREVLEKFLRATARGWEYAYNNREKAVDLLVNEFPNLKRDDELEAVGTMLRYAFNDNTKSNGWGAMDPAVWQEQIDLHAELKQFSKRVPKVDEVITLDILKATEATRPKLG
jgi:NitT/TauT family transport system substrate-binding protein